MVEVEITGNTLRVNGKFRGNTREGYAFKNPRKGSKEGEEMVIIQDLNASGLGIVASIIFADDLTIKSDSFRSTEEKP